MSCFQVFGFVFLNSYLATGQSSSVVENVVCMSSICANFFDLEVYKISHVFSPQ